MPILNLNTENASLLREWTHSEHLIVACLCAAWCDVCRDYRATLETLSQRHPDKYFAWIDIEDCADLIGDFEVENFPTLLIQRGAQIAFFGSVPPGLAIADRLLQSQAEKSITELIDETSASPERQRWRDTLHLRQRL